MSKVTIYIPNHNYGHFLGQAIESVLRQSMSDWELIVIDDGSTDETPTVLQQYRSHPQIRIVEQENKGLTVTNNIALRLANGQYIMRLDADDRLNENALLVLSNTLDCKPDIGLVYPDYYEIDEKDHILKQVHLPEIGGEEQLLDMPAHGACTMFRKEVLVQLGGYSELFSCQDGYELWLRFIEKYKPHHVNTPLFYYRRHGNNLTENQDRILETRRQIKRHIAGRKKNGHAFRVLGIVPATGRSVYPQSDPFLDIGGRPLIWYTLHELQHVNCLDRVIVSSENEQVLEYAGAFDHVECMERDETLSHASLRMQDLVLSILKNLERNSRYVPDAVCILYINTPLRKGYHIQKAIDTMTIFQVDSVISVQEELAHCYHHGVNGLEAIGPVDNEMRIERKSIYKENSAVYLSRKEVFEQGRLIGNRVGHIIMLPEESIKINSEYDLWLVKKLVETRGES